VSSKYYKKYIRIPPGESIDLRPIEAIINHPRFERLRHISQLGTTVFIFPGATHNRFEHALGVYSKAKRFCDKMAEEGFLTSFEAKNVPLFGLLHDIGHGPFSHLIEDLTPHDHDKNGAKIIDELKTEIEKSGGDIGLIKKLFAHKSQLYRIIMDKNLGMDKLDYLERDVFHTGFGQRPDIESVFNYLTYLKGGLVIDKKSLEAAKQMQRLYLYMYKEVYLHKSSLIAQRFLQKMIAIWLSVHRVNPLELWALNDHELMAKLYTDSDERLKFLYASYMRRNLPSTGLVFRIDTKQFRERLAGKEIKVVGESQEFFDRIARHSSPHALEALEETIAEAIGVPAHTVLVVPTLSTRRFIPEDISYHDEGKILSLKDSHPEYFDGMSGELQGYLAVRVAILGNRRVIHDNASKIHRIITDHISGAPVQPKNLTLTF
jgi:HD superfamily phosphohydrolase